MSPAGNSPRNPFHVHEIGSTAGGGARRSASRDRTRHRGNGRRDPDENIRLSPILTHHAPPPSGGNTKTILSPEQPQFAELLTPLKLRRRRVRQQQPNENQQPTSIPPIAGPSRLGYYTLEGDLYRGAMYDPTISLLARRIEEDAVSLGSGSTSSSSSNWSWGSGARAVIERVGEALGVRRGSSSSSSSSSDGNTTGTDTEDEHDTRSQGTATAPRKRRRRGSRLARTMTNLTRTSSDSRSPERPKRPQVPKRREFTLLLPPKEVRPPVPLQEADIGLRDSYSPSLEVSSTLEEGDWNPSPGKKSYPPDRVIVTPSLPTVIDHIRNIRLANGYFLAESTPPLTPSINVNVPVRRGGSAPGKIRGNKPQAFVNPPLPTRPSAGAAARTQSRLLTLRGAQAEIVRPKSASDLLGLAQLTPSPSPGVSTRGGGEGFDFSLPTRPSTPTLALFKDALDRKGKTRASGCWWLDVSCPSWEDLRDVGELLGLHPLTLEDVLQQDPREKLDTFDKLGYYFLVVRSLDENYFKYTPGSANSSAATFVGSSGSQTSPKMDGVEGQSSDHKKEGRRRGWGMGRASGKSASKGGEKVEIIEDHPGKEGLEGVGAGAVNVYLVVFADGIVSFHYDDISKHTKRVLDRVLTLANPDHGSDWIAHGLLDSIVDTFFPLIRYVDGEVDDIDSLTIDPTTDPKKTTADLEQAILASPSESQKTLPLQTDMVVEKDGIDEKGRGILPRTSKRRSSSSTQRLSTSFTRKFTTIFPSTIPRLHIRTPKPLIYIRLFFLPVSSAVKRKHEHQPQAVFDRSTMLKRITQMRRLVTGLTRTLGAKGAVIGRLRKRAKEEGGTVDAYLSDVEDHILLLQTSLYHYEYILSHCQPAYLSHLNVSFSFARGGTDQAILALSTVTILVLPMQLVIGLFSMNIHTPRNGDPASKLHKEADGQQSPFGYFGGIVVGIALVGCVMVLLVRYWRYKARIKWNTLRGGDPPSFWDGFWGWA